MNTRASFTLIELLVVIAIVAVLSVVVILVINPAELLKQARDSARLADMDTLARAVSLYEVQALSTSPGNASTTYFSLVDPTATTTAGTNCAGIPLTPPTGWTYHCAASSTVKKVDGTGWLPANLDSIPARPIASLPVDPVNTSSSGNYYSYTPGGSFAISAMLESNKYITTKAKEDGGYDPGRIEKGSNLALVSRSQGLIGWWKLDGDAADSSGRGFNGTLQNGPTWSSGKSGQAMSLLRASDQFVDAGTLASAKGNKMTATAWFKTTELNNNRIFSVIAAMDATGTIPDSGYHLRDYLMVNSGGKLQAQLSSYSSCVGGTHNTISAVSVDSVPTDTWTFGAVVFDYPSSTVKLYLNGAFQAQTTHATVSGCTSDFNYLWIGRRKTNVNMNGEIDDFRVYSRALSAAEIQAIYDATK